MPSQYVVYIVLKFIQLSSSHDIAMSLILQPMNSSGRSAVEGALFERVS
jgi:hypothetical protein